MRMDPDGTTYSRKIQQVKTVDVIHDSFFKGLGPVHTWRDWEVIKLSRMEEIQQKLFHLFTRYAYKYYLRSPILFFVFKFLSGLSSPYYMVKLLQMMLKRRTVLNDPSFHQYSAFTDNWSRTSTLN